MQTMCCIASRQAVGAVVVLILIFYIRIDLFWETLGCHVCSNSREVNCKVYVV